MTTRMARRRRATSPAIRTVASRDPPPGYQNGPQQGPAPSAQQAAAERDMFCRRDAAARTGYTTPDQAASHEQANGTVGGTLGGAALGAVIGAAAGNAGLGAAIGAGAGLIAGTAVGADNARHAASDVQAAYADAYYACMHEDPDSRRPMAYGPPPPGYGYPAYRLPPIRRHITMATVPIPIIRTIMAPA